MKQFIKFGVVGTIGFIVDATILVYLINSLSFEIPFARIISFIIAVFVTWTLNRNFTFTKNRNFEKRKEYIYYLSIQTIGALLNYIIFILLVYFDEFFKNNIIISLAIASVLAMFFNFFMIKRKIYNNSNNI
ncbi:GtrA family protein [Arcobacter sp. LA11]|uniref:GtrA family protein n=1 Tax=Arcobacter sp. LA11 TaxID=1898176 RepID=UPI0009328000|nr:GtrA family protein [Arcobacter sp. LA11]